MLSHYKEIPKPQETNPIFLFPDEDQMFDRINKEFDNGEEIKNHQFKLYEDRDEIFEGEGFVDDDVDRYETEEVKMANFYNADKIGVSEKYGQEEYKESSYQNQYQDYNNKEYKESSYQNQYQNQEYSEVKERTKKPRRKKKKYSSYSEQYSKYHNNKRKKKPTKYSTKHPNKKFHKSNNYSGKKNKYNSFYNPNKSRFNYKPSHYNYSDNYERKKPDVNDMDKYQKYYNDKYGNRVRKVNTKDLNNKVNKHGDQNQQYWRNRKKNVDALDFNTNLINSLISKTNMIKKLVDDSADGTNDQQIFISGLISKVVKKKLGEEEDDYDQADDDKPQGIITNNVIKSFKAQYFKNQLDDLQDLLKSSKKYSYAKSQVINGKYTDHEFKADGNSIYGFGDRNDLSPRECQRLPWRRPEQFFSGHGIKLYDTIHSNDIAQGGLGDCYFLAAISAIAEFPERLERLFLTKTYQKNGIYVIAMCIDGIWQDVVLDDKVPCDVRSLKPAFNRSKKSNELWVILLEKAWAKVHGGYLNIAAGLTREALRDLTGASAITYFTQKNREQLWEKLVEANVNKFIMTAGSDDLSNGSDALVEKIGICGSHAYSLLEVYELEKLRNGRYKILTPEESKEGMRIERLVKLRNPWGQGEWKGDWSDDSYLWTPELRKMLNFKKDGNDGVFLMSYSDFVKYYSDLQICYYHDGFKYSAIRLQSEKGGTVFLKFDIEIKGKYYFSLNQKNRRHFPKRKKYNYSHCHYIVARKEKNGKYDYIGGGMRADKENWIGEECEVGEYIVMLKTPWRSFVNEFSFSAYGKDDIDINQTTRENLPKNFTQGILTSHALEDTKNKLTSFARQKQPDCYYKTYDNQGGYGYIFFQNKTKNTILKATVELVGSKNITVCNPYSGLRPSVSVKPGECELIAYESNALPYSTQMRMMSSFKNSTKSESLKDQLKQSKTVLTKRYKGRTVDIKCYVLNHEEGRAFLYVNNTRNYTISEELEFTLNGCHIDGVYGSYIEICCKPGQERLLKIVADKGARSFSIKVKKMYYEIN